jgi:hypothetical protein
MLKIWRKIRQKLIYEGNLKRYLIYAFGEIVLVVIGILIAVKLNNWNLQRNSDAQIEVLLDKVEEDLVHNIGVTNEIINFYHVNDSLTKKVIYNQLTIEDYYKDDRLGNLLLRFQILKINTENTDKLLEKEENIPSRYDEVINAAKELRRASTYDEHSWIAVRDFYNDNMEFLMSQSLSMAKSDSLSIEKRYHYFTTDENYKKRVLNYWAKTSNMSLTTIYHRSATLELLGKLETIRNNYDPGQLHNFFNSLELNSFVRIDCEDVIPRNENQFYTNERFLIANMRDKQVHLLIKNSKGDLIGERKLDPGKYLIFQEPSIGIDADYFSTIECREDDQCIQKYAEERNGYLLIE